MEKTYTGGFGQPGVEYYFSDVVRLSWWLDSINEDDFSDDLSEDYLENYGEVHNYVDFEIDYDDLFDAFINVGVIYVSIILPNEVP